MNELIKKFIARFGIRPEAAAAAPGRLEVLGNHTDYNEGFVLSCAVGQNTRFLLARRPETSRCQVVDFRSGETMDFTLEDMDNPPPKNGSAYIIGMMNEMRKRGAKFTGFVAGLDSEVPLSAGMSSSAALETAAGLALGKAFGFELDKTEWARAGQGVENNFLGLKTGLLDQFSSLFGKADNIIMSDFRSVEVVDSLPLQQGYVFVVVNSMKKHNLVDSAYNVRRENCESAAAKLAKIYPGVKTLRDVTPQMLEDAADKLSQLELLRARHVVNECDRVQRSVSILQNGLMNEFGQLLYDSHESSRINFENSTPELDYLVELSHSIPGCIGARLSGGGFGGITIHLVETSEAERYSKRIAAAYELQTGIVPQTFICSIGDGAKLVL